MTGSVKVGTKNRISSTAARTAESCTVITANQGVRGGRSIELKQTVDAAVSSCPQVRNVLVAMRTGTPVQLRDKDVAMEEVRDQRGVWAGPAWGSDPPGLTYESSISFIFRLSLSFNSLMCCLLMQ